MSSSLMAEDECEVELRDMVAEALESNGVLPKIRAQLRASVFLALDENGRAGAELARRFENAPLRRLAGSAAGRRCLALVRELLACLQLDCTLSVLDAELEGVAGWREERPRLAAALGVVPPDEHTPLLAAVLAERERATAAGAEPPAAAGAAGSPANSAGDSASHSAGKSATLSGSHSGSPSANSAASSAPNSAPNSLDAALDGGGGGGGSANGDGSASEEEDSFFDSLPKMKPASALAPARREAPAALEPVRRNGDPPRGLLGDLPPLGGRGTLPPLRQPQLPGLGAPLPPPADRDPAEESISEELELGAGDSIVSDLQSDGLTEDVSINSATDLKADVLETT